MSLPGLVLELVLSGGLFLAALLLPYQRCGLLALEPAAEQIALLLSVAFLLGVLVDRFVDSLLEVSDRVSRCRWMMRKTVVRQRESVGRRGSSQSDPFPEDWLRHHVLSLGEAPVAWAQDLRVRIRVARSLAVLAPLIGASVLWGEFSRNAGWARGIGAVQHMTYLSAIGTGIVMVAVLACSSLSACVEGPRTDSSGVKGPGKLPLWMVLLGHWYRGDEAPGGLRRLVPAPVTLWWLVCSAGFAWAWASPFVPPGAVALGALLTGTTTLLAWLGWLRISGTYRQFLWDTARHGAPEQLARAMQAAAVDQGRGDVSRRVLS